MSITMLFYVAIFVFVMMIVGLGLTVREFRHGEPRRQAERAESKEPAERATNVRRKAA